jgi:hypothetical protein
MNPPTVTTALFKELWQRFGTAEHPAEWDGRIYGGSKISQRFWEYFKAIELLDLTAESIVLEIGGGSPQTGVAGFFAQTIATGVRRVIVMDSNVRAQNANDGNIEYVAQDATYDTLSALLRARPEITHVACVSVFEHIVDDIRIGITRAVNDAFAGDILVATLEFHAKFTFFEQQLNTETLGLLFQTLTNFYPDKIEASPIRAVNAFRPGWVPHGGPQATPQAGNVNLQLQPDLSPMWYPLSLRFRKM